MIKNITTEEVKHMTGAEGLVLQGCGGNPQEWLDGINETLTEEGILRGGGKFEDIYVFEHNRVTNILFPFDGMNPDTLDIGKLATWRIASHGNFGGTWLSDYLPNALGVSIDADGFGHEEDLGAIGVLGEDAPPITVFGEQPSHYRDSLSADGPYEDAPVSGTLNPPLRVYIENVHDERIGGFTIPLPASMETMKPFLDGIEVTDWQDIKIIEAYSPISGLGEAVTETMRMTMSPDALDELNYLAAKVQGLDNNERELYASVLALNRHCCSIAELVNLTENLGHFDLQPASDAAMLGEHLVDMEADKYHAAFAKLYASEDGDLRGITDYIDYLEKHLDYAAFGKEYADNEQGAFVGNGYLTEYGEFQAGYRNFQDIPTEYRLFTQPGEIVMAPMKIEDVDLAAAIRTLRPIIGGDHIHSTEDNTKMLYSGESRDYLLIAGRDDVVLYQAIEAYKRGTEAAAHISLLAEQPGARIFALRVNSRSDTDVVGDIVELNTKALRENISRHAIAPDKIDAVFSNGALKSYDLWSWAELPTYARDDVRKYDMHYPGSGLAEAASRYASITAAHEISSEVVGLDVFLSAVNAAYMAGTESHATKSPTPEITSPPIFGSPVADIIGQPVMVKNTDLAALLLEMHAVCGDYMKDAKYNIRTLANKGDDFFMMMNSQMLAITPANQLFHWDTTEHEAWMLAGDTPDVRTFVLSVTDRSGGRITGNLFEADLYALQDYIQGNSFLFTHLDAEMKDGTTRRFSLAEWGGMDRYGRDQLKSWTKHYDPVDEAKLTTYLGVLRWAVEENKAAVSPGEFLMQINAPYMAQARNVERGMLRLAPGAAKEILAQDAAPVMRLLFYGMEKLMPVDAAKTGLWISPDFEFAIHPRDCAGLEKWAQRAAGEMLRQAERGERDKGKSHGEEL